MAEDRKADKEKGKHSVTRREFITRTGVIAAGAAAAGQIFPAELKAVPPPKKWDRETEVVIVGTGYAGLSAAIEAHDGGAKVVVIEKAKIVGGNSAIASGAYNAVDPERQKKQGIEDSVDLHYKQTIEGGDFRADPEKVKYLVDHALEGLHWLEKQGVQFEPTVYTVVGALWPRSHDPVKKGRGGAIVRVLKEQCDKRNIPVLMQNKLTGIVREKQLEGAVAGVQVEAGGKKMFIRARKAVALCSGGFGADIPMRSKYDPRLGPQIPTTNVATATGEAITYAEDTGADVIGMDYIQLLIACNYYTRKYGSLTNLGIDSAIYVNTNGVRFVAEDARRDVMANAVLKQPKSVLLWVADEKCTKRFDEATTEKILKDGLSFRANTLKELAKILNEKFQIPVDTFLKTVAKYNEYAKAGKDPDFGKQQRNLRPLEQPPFYASPTQAGVHHTMGGIRTQGTTGQVIDRYGKPIPRLYAAGEVTGGVHGTNRLGGNATADCIVFGREVGKKAAAEKKA